VSRRTRWLGKLVIQSSLERLRDVRRSNPRGGPGVPYLVRSAPGSGSDPGQPPSGSGPARLQRTKVEIWSSGVRHAASGQSSPTKDEVSGCTVAQCHATRDIDSMALWEGVMPQCHITMSCHNVISHGHYFSTSSYTRAKRNSRACCWDPRYGLTI
jgi:hypothetical protein